MKKLTIKFKILFITGIILLISIGIGLILNISIVKNRYKSAIIDKMFLIALEVRYYSESQIKTLFPGENSDLSEYLAIKKHISDDISFCFIADNDKKIISHSDRSMIGSYLEDADYPDLEFKPKEEKKILNIDRYYEVVIPFFVSGTQAGTVHVGFRESVIKIEITRMIFQSILIFLVALFLAWAIYSYLITKTIINPISEFSYSINTILMTGNLNQTLKTQGVKEIDDLVMSFNKMLGDLYTTTISRDFFDNIIESIDDMILVTDRSGFIKDINKSLVKITGFRKEELLQKQVKEIFEESGKSSVFEDRTFLKFAQQGYIKNLNVHIKTTGEKNVPVSLTGSVMLNPENQVIGIVFVARDLREIQQLIAELKEFKDEFKDKKERLERFNKLMVGRELEMVNLKKEINELLIKTGTDEKYDIPEKKEEKNE